MHIQYGIIDNYLDITENILKSSGNPIRIPPEDEERNRLFGDPVPYEFKHIRIAHQNESAMYPIGEPVILYIFSDVNHVIQAGTDYQTYSITDIVYSYCYSNELLIIPADNHGRSMLFGDPMMGISKQITIDNISYDVGLRVAIYIPKMVLFRALMIETISKPILRLAEVTNWLYQRHTMVEFHGGNCKNFYELQLLVALFVRPQSIVLQVEMGLGQVSLTIAHRLDSCGKLVVLTSNERMMPILKLNQKMNHHNFLIQNATLGYSLLVLKGEELYPYQPGNMPRWSHLIKTITFEQLVEQHQLTFDTLVAGNLWHVRDHLDSILSTLTTVILSNGYDELHQKQTIDDILRRCQFKRVHVIKGGWGPCAECFYEVWLKIR